MGQDQSRLKGGQGEGTAAVAGASVSGTQGSTITTVPLAGVEGFQVVRLLPYSPAHKAGLVPYFDIITSLDHVLLQTEGKPALQFFKSYVANHRDQPVCFTVFNLHIRAYRDVYCVPSDAWGGGGLLGCSIEWSRAETCPERCVHVMDVLDGSPAARSGELKPSRDYIIGMQTAQEPLISLIKNESDFYSRIEGWHEEQRWTLERRQRFPSEAVDVPHILLFLVYNSEGNTVKEVAVEMGTNPEAALGMSVATGLLHIIPSAATAGSAATAFSLPVMNKFVRVEESVAVSTTPEVVAPSSLSLAPAPSLHTPAAQLEEDRQQQQAQEQQWQQQLEGQQPSNPSHPPPPPPPPTAAAQPHTSGENGEMERQHSDPEQQGHAAPLPLEEAALDLPPPQDAAPAALIDHPPPYTSPEIAQLPPLPPPSSSSYHHAPPSTSSQDIVPPPQHDGGGVNGSVTAPAAIAVDPPPCAASQPPPTPPSAGRSTPRRKKNPLLSALASLEAYENPPSAAAAAVAAAAVSAPAAVKAVEQSVVTSNGAAQQVTQGAPAPLPSSAPSPPLEAAQSTITAASAPPPVPPPTAVPAVQRANDGFSMTNMPPPLHFPVFPAAALKRQQK